jgi:hypothetical protein
MQVETIVTDAAMNFFDCAPQVKEIMLHAFEVIMTHENAVDGANPEDFKVHYASDEPTNNFGGAFITSIFGSYLLHDLRVEDVVCDEEDQIECTIAIYSLSKISDQ